MRDFFDEALSVQSKARQRKEEIALEAQVDEKKGDYIVAIYMLEQMNSPRCWRTVEDAKYYYKALKSESARLREVKEQILM